jgi:hypothetical protein
MIKIKCNCWTELTVLSTGSEEVITQFCTKCSIYAYALGYADKTASTTEKTTHATIMASRRTIRVL